MWGGCHPLREPLPFGPVIDALRSVDLHIDSQAKLSAATASLAPYLPAVARQLPTDERGATADPETGGDAQRLMRAVHELLGVLGPVVLAVEDLHWVDEATRDLLLLARNPPQDLRLVLTYRAEDLPEHGNVLGAPYRRPVGVGGTEIALSPFTESEVRELAVSVIGPAAATALGGSLFERSQGLPLVAEEDLLTVADRLARSPADGAQALEDMGVPRALQEALNSRLAVLAPEAVAVVQAAAVLAVPATEELLAALAGLEEEQAEAGLEAALEASVLSETSPGWYGFRHVLARRAVYDRILGPRRLRLHRRAVDALSEQPPPPLVRIAHHTRQLGDTRAWLPRALAAADQAVAVGDDGIATDLLQQLLAEPSLPVEDRTHTALALARIAVNRADPTASVALLEHILADPALPTLTLGEIRLSLARLATSLAQSSTAGLERAVGELVGRPDLAAVAMATIGMRVVNDAPADEALAWMDRALETVALTTDPVAHATVLASRITLLAALGDPLADELLEQLPRRSPDLKVQRQCARARVNTAELAFWRGDERSRTMADDAEVLSHRVGYQLGVVICGSLRLRLDFMGGAGQAWTRGSRYSPGRSRRTTRFTVSLSWCARGWTSHGASGPGPARDAPTSGGRNSDRSSCAASRRWGGSTCWKATRTPPGTPSGRESMRHVESRTGRGRQVWCPSPSKPRWRVTFAPTPSGSPPRRPMVSKVATRPGRGPSWPGVAVCSPPTRTPRKPSVTSKTPASDSRPSTASTTPPSLSNTPAEHSCPTAPDTPAPTSNRPSTPSPASVPPPTPAVANEPSVTPASSGPTSEAAAATALSSPPRTGSRRPPHHRRHQPGHRPQPLPVPPHRRTPRRQRPPQTPHHPRPHLLTHRKTLAARHQNFAHLSRPLAPGRSGPRGRPPSARR